LNQDIIKRFTEVIPENRVLQGEMLQDRFDHIWTMDKALQAICLLMPESTSEVSQLLKICHDLNQSVILHGGLTNLVGGTETDQSHVVLSLERLNKIEEIDTSSRTMTVQSGVILQHVHEAAVEQELDFPLNFGARGSAQIGGIISTNAGGLRVLKYGMTRQLVLGLEVVLADGTVINSMKKIVKDNSGYDLKQWFIGAEGTLGIITRAVLKLQELPSSRCAAYAAVNSYDQVVKLLKFMDQGLAGRLSGFELIWDNSYRQMTSTTDSVRPPLPYDYKYYVLLEAQGSNQIQDQKEFQRLLEQSVEEGVVDDAVMAQSPSDIEWFFRIREDVNNLADFMTHDQHFDISLPIPKIGSYIEDCYNKLKQINGVEQIYAFGHVADGNIHFMIGKQNPSDELRLQINEAVYGKIQSVAGSISAEHGIGLHKKAYLPLSRSREEILLMQKIKGTLDPKNILNPGRIIDKR
jgi:FAD/FMN-containing dehydrogenase